MAATDKTSVRDRYLLLDSRVVRDATNAKLTVGKVQKHAANPLFTEDRPWEKRFDNLYGNVLYDDPEQLYKCWYSPFIVDHSAKGMSFEERQAPYDVPDDREMGICYATSKNGIRWDKPNLGLVEFDGSKANNIVWRGPHGSGVFRDDHEANPQRRFKIIYQGLYTAYSPDGLHWSAAKKMEDVSVRGDTHNNALYAPTLGKYVGITRTWGDTGREVMRIESEDFVTWKPDRVVMRAADKSKQPYAMPVFYYGGVYLGLVAVHEMPPVDRVWTELAWSPDTVTWHRIDEGTPLIACSERLFDYDYGCVYACADPVFRDNEIQIFYGGSDYKHYGWREGSLCLATLRPDGFAGYQQEKSDVPGVVVTTNIPYQSQSIAVTADVEEGGYVRGSIVDGKGTVLAEANEIANTVTDQRLRFNKSVTADTIQIRLEFANATLYSFKVA